MKKVLLMEANALNDAALKLGDAQSDQLVDLFQSLVDHEGHLFFCGVGKSGIIGQKLASTFTSLGLPSHFLHPTEALHGDLGKLREIDAVVFLSKSGTTEEIMKILPYLIVPSTRWIGLLGNMSSPLAKNCRLVFDCSVAKEACLNNQAPTTSSTLALAMGDAMAVLFEEMVELTKERFAIFHPGGLLGKSLRVKVSHLMIDKSECPVVSSTSNLREVLLLMTKFPVGGCAVCGPADQFLGMIVEGDIRRTFTNENSKGLESSVTEIMNPNPVSVSPEEKAFDALKMMEKRKREIFILPVIRENKFLGMIRLHDLLKEGFSLN